MDTNLLGIAIAILSTNFNHVEFTPIECKVCNKPHHIQAITYEEVKGTNWAKIVVNGKIEDTEITEPEFKSYMLITTNFINNAEDYEYKAGTTNHVRTVTFQPVPTRPLTDFRSLPSRNLRNNLPEVQLPPIP